MISRHAVEGIKTFYKLKYLRRSTPFVVYWSLLNRCNARCKYCTIWDVNAQEFTTRQVFSVMDEMAEIGTRKLIFTGGEPLLREDLSEIINYASFKKIDTTIISNGSLLCHKIDSLKKVNMFVFSFDGPREIHDMVRGKGSFEATMDAVKIAKASGIKVSLITVLTKYNLKYIRDILDTVADLDVSVSFQPVLDYLWEDKKFDLNPDIADYQDVIRELIRQKATNRRIRNSLSGLSHLLDWPNFKPLTCSGGLISCRINTHGYVGYCQIPQSKKLLNCREVGFKKAFENLSPLSCSKCGCGGKVELNLLHQLKPDVLLNLLTQA